MDKSPFADVKLLPFNTCMFIMSNSAPDETSKGFSKSKRKDSPFEVQS